MAVNDDKCKDRRMRAICIPNCLDDAGNEIKSCLECELSGKMIK